MDCLCGKKMTALATTLLPYDKLSGQITLWCCPPDGCGRIYLEGKGLEVGGTFYLAERNDNEAMRLWR
jgi:hypothetical protein